MVVTASVRGVDEPHELLAVTDTVPLFAPVVAVIEFMVDVPVHPFGNVHVYEVAPGTAVTE